MSDPVSLQVGQQLAGQTTPPSSEKLVEIDIRDQSRFEDALNRQENPSANSAQTETGTQHGDATLGEAILNGLEKMKCSHDTRCERIEQQLTGTEEKAMSVQDCVKLQFEVMQMSMEQELTGKIADKTSQGVQTLFKNG